jgi:hypothetical protein
MLSATDARPVGRPVEAKHAATFFDTNADKFAPEKIYRAKTWARLDGQLQLPFVDVNLLPFVERDAGAAITQLIEGEYGKLQRSLAWADPSAAQGQWMLKNVFWLVSAKMLRDKGVDTFADLDLGDVQAVFKRVAQHHSSPVTTVSPSEIPALAQVAADIADSPNLRFATTEALAFLYENAMITPAVRRELGTHSTPAYLVDYLVGRLAQWIEQIDVAKRNVFEPACGHAGFLVAAMRVLTELLPKEKATAANRREYLRKRIHGCEIDPFALEIARLSLTLADVRVHSGKLILSGLEGAR